MDTTLQINRNRTFWDHIPGMSGVFGKISVFLPRAKAKNREVLNPEIERERIAHAADDAGKAIFQMMVLTAYIIK